MGKQLRDHFPGGRQSAAVVITKPSIGNSGRQGIHDHIARAGVKGGDVLQSAPGAQQRYIADSADILQCHVLGFTAVQQELRVGYQRRAQASGGHIPDAEIADHRAAKFLGQPGRVADLQRTPDSTA